ncbi:NAD(P)H-dependent oxidoreductase [Ulvibacter litoralis]|uniref:Nitroreductase n=1 Tax=Ulvibacter litoralis TaxID=227084 RepID=A0A1G7JBJ4_9FLAO|nr:NAD(P)H-dependent oxidoreductase [Ulvibacter litoralis]GHC64522.1 NAD(P)H-dependent oxidoreductase [Ulvibacter litoralis]SDF22253.1 Nitroreductase [Ulvibacter litoralis]
MAKTTLESLQWRYATKKFDATKKLSEEKLSILKESFNLTATSYGLQPLKMVVVSTSEIKQKLVPLTMHQPQVNDASHVFVICTEAGMSSERIKEYFDLVETTRNTERSILAPFETFLINDFSEKSEEAINIWMAKQAYLALGNLLTVCALEEIDSCPIEGFEPKKYDKLLQLTEKGLQSVLVLAVGYRADDDLFSTLEKVRKGVDNVIIDF